MRFLPRLRQTPLYHYSIYIMLNNNVRIIPYTLGLTHAYWALCPIRRACAGLLANRPIRPANFRSFTMIRYLKWHILGLMATALACSPAKNDQNAINTSPQNDVENDKTQINSKNTNVEIKNKNNKTPKPFVFTVDLEQFYRQTLCDDQEKCQSLKELGKKPEIPIHISNMPGANVAYDLDCNGDGTFEHTKLTQSHVCSYESQKGIVKIAMRGEIPGIVLCGEDEYGGKLGFSNNYGPASVLQWGDIAWKTMENFAKNCLNLTLEAKDAPNLNDVTSMASMFENAAKFNQPIEHWDVSHIQDMSHLFSGAEIFNQPLAKWNVANVKDMSSMFSAAFAFNQPIGTWHVANVTSMSNMFHTAQAFNQPLASWNVANVTDMSGMFTNALAFNQPLASWNVANVTDMSGMFRGAIAFNQPLATWRVSNVKFMEGMFNRATAFNQPLADWDTSKVTTTNAMFWGATSFNQDISNWNRAQLKDTYQMFYQSGVKTPPDWYKPEP